MKKKKGKRVDFATVAFMAAASAIVLSGTYVAVSEVVAGAYNLVATGLTGKSEVPSSPVKDKLARRGPNFRLAKD